MRRKTSPEQRETATEPEVLDLRFLTRHRRASGQRLRLALAGGLGIGAALLVSCGGGSSALIPAANAGQLKGDFDAVAAAVSAGSCSQGLKNALIRTRRDLAALPATLDSRLIAQLQKGVNALSDRAHSDCKPRTPTSTTTTDTTPTTPTTTTDTNTTPTGTDTTPTITTNTNTDTTPTTTTNTGTTPTSTDTTPTVPDNGGGTPAPSGKSAQSGGGTGGGSPGAGGAGSGGGK